MRYVVAFFAFLLSVTVYGQNDYSLSFDGADDYVEISHNASLDLLDISITFWMKTTNSTSGISSLIVKENFNNNDIDGEWWVYINHMQSDKINFFVIENNTYGGALHNTLVNDDTWHFVSVTRNGFTGEQIILIDGQNAVSVIGPSGLLSEPVSLYFGGVNNYSFDGNIDDVTIWNTILTQQEIQQYMNCPPTGNEEGLVGYWNFEEGSGTTAFDQSSNGNDGTIINGATYSTDVPEQNCDNDICEYQEIEGFIYGGFFEDSHYYISNDLMTWTRFPHLSLVPKILSIPSVKLKDLTSIPPIIAGPAQSP